MIRSGYGLGILLFTAFALTSCEREVQECYEVVDVRTNNFFTQRIIIDSTFTLPDSSLIDSTIISYRDTFLPAAKMLTIDGDQQLAFYPLGTSPNRLSVPFNPAAESLRYQIQFDTTVAFYDTLTFYYRPSLHFISNACGYTYYYTIDSVRFTTNGLDSMTYIDKNVTMEASKRNILFYFFP